MHHQVTFKDLFLVQGAVKQGCILIGRLGFCSCLLDHKRVLFGHDKAVFKCKEKLNWTTRSAKEGEDF